MHSQHNASNGSSTQHENLALGVSAAFLTSLCSISVKTDVTGNLKTSQIYFILLVLHLLCYDNCNNFSSLDFQLISLRKHLQVFESVYMYYFKQSFILHSKFQLAGKLFEINVHLIATVFKLPIPISSVAEFESSRTDILVFAF